jgi:uncharacterized short protein YbdD (DUF466 family)
MIKQEHPAGWWARLQQALRLMVGVGDYQRYVAHQRSQHPDAVVLTEAQFIAARQQSRYGKGGQRCC